MPGPVERATASPNGLDLLLAVLDPDRERAAEKLLLLRRKLLKFFAWSRAPFPDELADETLDRVSRRLAEGEVVRQLDPGAYVHGFARNVLRESWSRPRLVRAPEAALAAAPAAEQSAAERRSRCLDRCLARLPVESRRLLLAYYQTEGGAAKIASHRQLAAELNVSGGNLRLRLHRLRLELEGCVRACLAEAPETEASSAHVLSRGGSEP
jgi:DNA-directed RNA polymerase specialized sigma24 family protein